MIFLNTKKKRILEFLVSATTPKEKQETDLNVLLKTYQDWYKIFPFELSFFAELKDKFYPTIPKISFAGQPIVNRYSGVAIVKMHTKSTLFDALIELTNKLLTQINGATLQEKGLLTDTNKHKLDLIINKRKLKLKQGYTNNSTDEDTQFRKIIKEWFKDEVKFIDEITPLIKALPAAPTTKPQEPAKEKPETTKAELLKTSFEKYGFFSLEKVCCLTPENQNKLVNLISENDLPYKIAMIEFLGFISYLEKNFEDLQTLKKRSKKLSNWFNSDTDGRAVRGNISVLSEKAKPTSKTRYTAHKHKKAVEKDYNTLK